MHHEAVVVVDMARTDARGQRAIAVWRKVCDVVHGEAVLLEAED
jgi:hypothetical protein